MEAIENASVTYLRHEVGACAGPKTMKIILDQSIEEDNLRSTNRLVQTFNAPDKKEALIVPGKDVSLPGAIDLLKTKPWLPIFDGERLEVRRWIDGIKDAVAQLSRLKLTE